VTQQPKGTVALVYDAIYPYVKGGAERRYFEIGKCLALRGYDVHLYGMQFWPGDSTIQRDGLTLHGLCKARPLYAKSGRRSIAQALIFGLSCFKLLRANFDMIDCCGFPYFSLFPAKLAAVIRRRPLHATWLEVWGRSYWREYLGLLGSIGFLVERLAARLPDRIIAISDTTSQRLRSELRYSGQITTVPSGIDIGAIADVAPSARTSDVIYVGRLVDFKNVDLLLHALALVKAGRPATTAIIVGDGPERGGLEALARRLGLAASVQFTGFIDDSAEVYSLMKASKVFVLPSQREGFGNVVIEAAATGLPVITVDAPHNAAVHLVTPATGVVVRPDPGALAAAISEQLSSPSRGGALAQFAARFDWSAIADAVEGVMKRVTA
jgi:glycosyltransferase involved in cell wall biosynthesis